MPTMNNKMPAMTFSSAINTKPWAAAIAPIATAIFCKPVTILPSSPHHCLRDALLHARIEAGRLR